nr:uncharacterized protein LOC110123568 [Odocoileus virginianus texanus]
MLPAGGAEHLSRDQVEEGLGGPWGDPRLPGSPSSQRLGQSRRPGAAHPTVATRVLWASWPGLLSCSSSSLSAQVVTGPGHQGSVPGLHQPPGRRLREPFLQLLARLPVSVSAGSISHPVLTQPASLSGSISQTLPHPDQQLQWWWFLHTLVPAEAREHPHYLLNFYSDSDKHQGSGVPSLFSGSEDASASAGRLLVSGLQPEAEADYACAVGHRAPMLTRRSRPGRK